MPFLIAAFLLFTAVLAPAQNPSADDPKQKAADMTVMMLSQSLSLTPAQQDQLRPIVREKFKKADAIRNNASLSDEQKLAKFQELYESGRQEVDGFLTPEQKGMLDHLAASLNQAKASLSAGAENPSGN